MFAFVVRRTLVMIPTVFFVGVASFFLGNLIPGNPAEIMLGAHADQASIDALTERMGYNEPLHTRFVAWLSRVVRGDLGESVFSRMKVTTLIASRIEPSIIVAVCSLFIYGLAGIVIGVISAVKRDSWIDQLVMASSLTLASLPTFWIGLNLMLLFSGILRWLPSSGYPGVFASGDMSNLRYLVMPILAIAIPSTGFIARICRSYALDILSTDYIRTAQSKGLSSRRIIWTHMMRNVLIPVIAILGVSFATLITKAVVTETVFGVPGIGRLVVEAINSRDYPVLQALLMLMSLIYVVVMFICDILYALVDPRVQYS